MAFAIEAFRCGPLDNGVYVLYDSTLGRATIVDPSFDCEPALDFIAERALQLESIVNTHGHFDHVANNAACHAMAPRAEIYLHPLDEPLLTEAPAYAARFGLALAVPPEPTISFVEGTDVVLAGTPWQVLHVPGHSPGSVCLYGQGILIGGDVLFRGSIGRTDLPGGSQQLLLSGIREKLLVLPYETPVYPGHGATTSIGVEARTNPFLR